MPPVLASKTSGSPGSVTGWPVRRINRAVGDGKVVDHHVRQIAAIGRRAVERHVRERLPRLALVQRDINARVARDIQHRVRAVGSELLALLGMTYRQSAWIDVR